MEWPEIVGRGREIEVDGLLVGLAGRSAWAAVRLSLGPRLADPYRLGHPQRSTLLP
jgi:hypothetical protein